MQERDVGFFVGLLLGAGHFGGDGKQPQITVKMHERHVATFRWLERAFPGGRLYGPYHHGGRHYYQWMVRGAYLREVIAPLLRQNLELLDDHVAARFQKMCRDYSVGDTGAAPPSAPAPS